MNISTLTNKNNKSIRTEVYAKLRQEITGLKFEPGRAISENEISKLLQVSRTPVREAFLRLSQEDLITVYPQKTSTVSLIDLDHLEETRFMREHLEVAVTKLACELFSDAEIEKLNNTIKLQKECIEENRMKDFYGLDDQFHSIIFKECNKSRTWNIVQNMMSINFSRVRLLSLSEKLNTDTIISQHEEIVQAIKERDVVQAEKVVRKHLSLVTIDYKELIKKFPSYFK
ncbi:GntR family transcriptional regulator [Alteribacillus bidgolensis]|uniref:DNA-binding transcriptional regulator, GntR family n=1 Tax=Alteribacillus bidgolensis TaxID=930129 RepID=A0A1G8EAN0_9BACI|nr:GntR family transcriptional regulator [Alteribacillus bidgolensis]SDH66975.1 DNA-binding transcriptional regulator, GntR family [Alteribacillus bidgolensis]